MRTIVATKLCALFGTRVSRLRIACVRQRCQAAPRQCGGDRVGEPRVRIRGDEADAVEAAGDERAQDGKPSRPVLSGYDVEAERLAEAVTVDADRVHDADVDRAAALAALDHQRVECRVRAGAAVERAGAEVLDDRVEALSNLETCLFDICSTQSCCTSFSTRRVETPAR